MVFDPNGKKAHYPIFPEKYFADDVLHYWSGQVTKLWRHHRYSLRPIFQGNRVFSHVTCCHWLEWRYYAWFRLADNQIRLLTLHLDLSKAIRGHWPWLVPYITIVTNSFFFVLEVPKPNTWLIDYIDMFNFIVPLYLIQCQPGPFTQFALRQFWRWVWHCSLPGCYASQIFRQ